MSKNISDNVVVAGKTLACTHCGGGTFLKGQALLNTKGMTFLRVEFANQEADCYTCRGCGYVHWFNPAGVKFPVDDI